MSDFCMPFVPKRMRIPFWCAASVQMKSITSVVAPRVVSKLTMLYAEKWDTDYHAFTKYNVALIVPIDADVPML